MSDSLTTIATAASPMEAEFIKDRLLNADIPAFVVGDHIHSLQFQSLSCFCSADIRIQVPASLADDALALLNEPGEELPAGSLHIPEDIVPQLEHGPHPDDPLCPHCGSDLLGKADIPLWLFMLSVILLGLPLLLLPRKTQCRSCGALQ